METQEIFHKLLDHPRLALVVTFLAIAATFSGRFSVTATRLFVLLAWLTSIYSLYGYPAIKSRPWLLLSSIVSSGILLFCFGAWAKPEAVPRSFGVITPHRQLLFGKNAKYASFEFGDSGVFFLWGGPQGTPFLTLARDSDLTIEKIGSHVMVSTQLRDNHGNLVAEINRNEWRVSSAAWDRNYNDEAFEVKDSRGHIVLQVVAKSDRIQLQGEWRDETGRGVRIVKSPDPKRPGGLMVLLGPWQDNDETRIQPIFEYPSELHFGELRKH